MPTHVPRTVTAIQAMRTEELEAIVASTPDGVDWLIRSYLAALNGKTRQALRAALGELGNEAERASDAVQIDVFAGCRS